MDTETTETTTSKKIVPPYMSWKTFSGYLKSLSQGIPDPIDTSGMISLNGSNRNLAMNALRFLKLVDDKNHPTKDLRPLVDALSKEDSADKKSLLKSTLEKAYPSLFEAGYDLATSTPARFAQKFKDAGLGGETVKKGEAFFIEAAKDAGITVSPYILGSRKKGPKPGSGNTVSKLKKKPIRQIMNGNEESGASEQEVDVRSVMLETLAEKFPDFDPNWSTEAQEAWFTMYGRLLNLVEAEEDEGE